jgi:hypothetical protein
LDSSEIAGSWEAGLLGREFIEVSVWVSELIYKTKCCAEDEEDIVFYYDWYLLLFDYLLQFFVALDEEDSDDEENEHEEWEEWMNT